MKGYTLAKIITIVILVLVGAWLTWATINTYQISQENRKIEEQLEKELQEQEQEQIELGFSR